MKMYMFATSLIPQIRADPFAVKRPLMPTAAAFKPEYQPFEVKREHLVPRNPLGAGQVNRVKYLFNNW